MPCHPCSRQRAAPTPSPHTDGVHELACTYLSGRSRPRVMHAPAPLRDGWGPSRCDAAVQRWSGTTCSMQRTPCRGLSHGGPEGSAHDVVPHLLQDVDLRYSGGRAARKGRDVQTDIPSRATTQRERSAGLGEAGRASCAGTGVFKKGTDDGEKGTENRNKGTDTSVQAYAGAAISAVLGQRRAFAAADRSHARRCLTIPTRPALSIPSRANSMPSVASPRHYSHYSHYSVSVAAAHGQRADLGQARASQ